MMHLRVTVDQVLELADRLQLDWFEMTSVRGWAIAGVFHIVAIDGQTVDYAALWNDTPVPLEAIPDLLGMCRALQDHLSTKHPPRFQ